MRKTFTFRGVRVFISWRVTIETSRLVVRFRWNGVYGSVWNVPGIVGSQ